VDNIDAKKIAYLEIKAEDNNYVNIDFYKASDGKYYAQYNFQNVPKGKHLEFFAQYVEGKYLEISPSTWDALKDDTIRL